MEAQPLDLPRRMAATDALFSYAERALPSFRPMIAGLYMLERAPTREASEAAFEAAIALVPRLRERVYEVPLHLGLPEWVEDVHFDRDYHVRRVSLPAPGTRRALLDLAATLLATPLDRERPLWEAYWIERVEGERVALFFKMHHAMVDGVGSMAILNALTQRTPDAGPPKLQKPRRRRRRSPPTASERLLGLALDNAREGAGLALRASLAPLRMAARPSAAADQLRRTLRGLQGMAEDLRRPPIRDPLARDSSGLSRRLDVMELELERLRKIKAPLGVTLNDLILAALAGALGRYHRERRVRVAALNCLVPMNLRGRDEGDRMGNRVGIFSIVLPLTEKDPARRLQRIVDQTSAAKSDKRGAAAPFLVESLNLIPGAVFGWLARRSLGRVNVACTNVPGVGEPRYLGGVAVDAIYPFASVVEGTPVVIALLSYAQRMDVGIDTDPEAIPDPHRIAQLLAEGLDEYEKLSSRPGRRRARGRRTG